MKKLEERAEKASQDYNAATPSLRTGRTDTTTIPETAAPTGMQTGKTAQVNMGEGVSPEDAGAQEGE